MERLLNLTDLARELNVKIFTIQIWEKEFGFVPEKFVDGRKVYTKEDLNNFMKIKDLIFNKKFNLQLAKMQFKFPTKIKNVEKVILQENKTQNIKPATTFDYISEDKRVDEFFGKLSELKNRLIKFKEFVE